MNDHWFELPKYESGLRCPLCQRDEADDGPHGCKCWDIRPTPAQPELANARPKCGNAHTTPVDNNQIICLCGYVGQAKTSPSG